MNRQNGSSMSLATRIASVGLAVALVVTGTALANPTSRRGSTGSTKKEAPPIADDALKAKNKAGDLADDALKAKKPKPGSLVDDAAAKAKRAGQVGKTDQLIDDLLRKQSSSGSLADDVKARAGNALGGAAAPSATQVVKVAPGAEKAVKENLRSRLQRQDSFSTARANNSPNAVKTLENINKWVDDYVNQHIIRINKNVADDLKKGKWSGGSEKLTGRADLADDAVKRKETADSNTADKTKKPKDVEKVESRELPEVKASKQLKDVGIPRDQQLLLKQIADDAVRSYEQRLLTKMRQEAAEDSVLKQLQSKTKTPAPSGTQPVAAP